jgi:hypothetical protein
MKKFLAGVFIASVLWAIIYANKHSKEKNLDLWTRQYIFMKCEGYHLNENGYVTNNIYNWIKFDWRKGDTDYILSIWESGTCWSSASETHWFSDQIGLLVISNIKPVQ